MDIQIPYAMKLSCKRCATELHAKDIDMDQHRARCPQCHTMSFIDDPAGTGPPRDPVPLPPSITVDDRGSALHLVRRWYKRTYIAVAVVCVIWNLFSVFMYFAIVKFANIGSLLPLLIVLTSSLPGLGMLYFTLAGLMNHTRIVVSSRTLRIEHGPLPWPGSRTVEADNLEQLFCEEHTVSGTNGQDYHFYNLCAHLRGGSKLVLIKHLPEPDQALYLEKTIEQRLGIEDRPVPGAL